MSYDLFFLPQHGSTLPDSNEFCSYFEMRDRYQVKGEQAWYSNDDTGVYFSFECSERQPLPGIDDETELPPRWSFNLNYYRPHIFGTEAEPEVAALVETFGFAIDDPQIGGMGQGPYSSEGFLNGWNHGNRFAHRAILTSEGAPHATKSLPAREIERFWRWNYSCKSRQGELGEDIFVPRVMFFLHQGRIASFVVWTDAGPLAMPRVDYLLLYRDQLSLNYKPDGKPDFALVAWQDWMQKSLTVEQINDDCWFIRHTGLCDDMADWFQQAPPLNDKLEGIPVDQILDEELVAETTAQIEA